MIKRTSEKIICKALAIALCVSLSTPYVALAAPLAKMQASVNTPKLRGAYVNPNNVKLEGDVLLSRGNQIITVSLRDSDVKQSLRMFADKAGLNIVFHSSVDGKITMDLVNVTLNNAFKMIMQMSELTYIIDNDTIMVMSTEASKKLDISKENMSIIPIKYVDAAAIAQFLNKNIFSINKPGLSNNEIVVTNPGRNELLVFGTDNDYKMAKRIAEKLDTKPVITTFKVNHTTPKEMSTLICQSLFSNPVSGAATGGAAEPSSSESSSPSPSDSGAPASSDSGASSGSSGTSDLVLGGGVVACRVALPAATNKLNSLMNSSLAIVYKPALGAISVIGGSPEQIAMINDFITTNDKKQPQAFIEFSIVELTENGSKEFNNNWNIASNSFSASFGKEGLGSDALHPLFWSGSKLSFVDAAGKTASELSKYTGPFAVTQSISYLIKNGKGRVLANPKVMVTNGKRSVIDLTSDYIKSTSSQVIMSNGIIGAVQKTYTIGNDNGMKIELTPFISPDGYVSMNIKPNYSTIKSQIEDVGEDGKTSIVATTLLQRRNLDLSNVRIKDGETLVIGGLIQELETQQVTKMPILGDLPYVGVFFRNSKKGSEKAELVIMITPRIVVDTEDVTRL